MKLIKLSDNHYIVVDDSKTVTGMQGYNPDTKDVEIFCSHPKYNESGFLITHSYGKEIKTPFTLNLPLSEVEEVINGYSVEKMAKNSWNKHKELFNENSKNEFLSVYKTGFKAHQELVKDKLFTVEDMRKCFHAGGMHCATEGKVYPRSNSFEEHIRSLLPKTEWDVRFNEQGKIKLI